MLISDWLAWGPFQSDMCCHRDYAFFWIPILWLYFVLLTAKLPNLVQCKDPPKLQLYPSSLLVLFQIIQGRWFSEIFYSPAGSEFRFGCANCVSHHIRPLRISHEQTS